MTEPATSSFSRRDLLIGAGKLSLAGIAVLAGTGSKAFAVDQPLFNPAQDINVLNEILGTEYEGIGIYQIFIDGGLFQKDILKLTRLFQGHHKTHSEVLVSAIKNLGGTPVTAKSNNTYAMDLNTGTIKTQNDALQLLTKLENGAANAYIGMLPFTKNRELAKMAGRIAADEVMHWTSFANTLKEPLPANAMSFGA